MYSEQMWQNAKKKCRLNDADIALAKRLGLTSQSLIKNIPSKNEPWNAPVSVWLYEMDAKQQKRRLSVRNAEADRIQARINASILREHQGGYLYRYPPCLLF